MTNLTERAEQWPRRNNGQIIFKNSNQAVFYANLIYNNKRLVDEIDMSLRAARRDLIIQRQRNGPNMDKLMELAVKAQFFRECMDEVKRIREEQ